MIKNPKASQMDALRMHAHECGLSHGHEFFARQSTLEQQHLEQAVDKSNASSPSGSTQGVKRSATFNESTPTPTKKAKKDADDLDLEGADDGMGEDASDFEDGDDLTPAKKKRGPTLNSKRTNLYHDISDGLFDLR